MYDFAPPDARRAPLDFDSPHHTDTVADALGPDPSDHDAVPAPGIDSAALLVDVGVPGHAVRSIVTSRSAAEV